MQRPPVLVLCALAPLTGCAGTTLDAADTERAIRTAVVEQVGAAIQDVACPDGVEPEAGGRFRCTVTGTDGTRGAAMVTQTDGDGHVRVRAPFLHTGNVERIVSRGIEEQSGARRVRLRCPDIVVVDVGAGFVCRARAGRRRARVRVVQQDAKGRVRWELVPR